MDRSPAYWREHYQLDAMELGARVPVRAGHVVDRFEDETGLTYDAQGPAIQECECGDLVQYMRDHDCYIIRGNDYDAARMDDRD